MKIVHRQNEDENVKWERLLWEYVSRMSFDDILFLR